MECVTISYRKTKDGFHTPNDRTNPRWYSANLSPKSLLRLFKHTHFLVEKKKPDVVWAGSDVLHIAIGLHFSLRFRIPLFVDFYDNYRSFGLTQVPGANLILKRACRHATGITVSSQALQHLVEEQYSGDGKTFLIPNGVPRTIFYKREKAASRRELNLPEDATLIGTAGSLDETRGIDTLFEAFLTLAVKHKNAYLVVAGPRKASHSIPQHPRIVDLGLISIEDVAVLYSALDVGVVCNKSDHFGNYCAPMKAEEMIACELSTVAARTRSAELDFQNRGVLLYEPQNESSLASSIELLVSRGGGNHNAAPRYWDNVAVLLARDLHSSIRMGLDGSTKL